MFSFGKNWLDFVENEFSQERVDISRKCMLDFLGLENFYGKTFLDIGCGSGLSSLAAFEAGAANVTGFDFDPVSVKASNRLREKVGSPENWVVYEGSILDGDFISSLEKADIVYAWGVLHHTRDLWKALANVIHLVKENGFLFLALYTAASSSDYWSRMKKKYNASSFIGKKVLETWYVSRHAVIPSLARLQNPAKEFFDYKSQRGMSFFTDVKDWLGGYPYTPAFPRDVLRFCNFFGLESVKMKIPAPGSLANTEYLFRKTGFQ